MNVSGRSVGRNAIVALAVASMLGFLNASSLSPFLPEMAADLNSTVPRLGQLTTALFLVAAGIGLLVGPVADARGSRRMMLVGLAALLICALGTAVATSYLALLLFRLSGAIAAGTLGGVSLALAALLFEGDARRRAIGWVTGGIAGGAILGIPVLTAVGSIFSWRVSFIVLALMALLAAVLVSVTIPDDAKSDPLNVRAMLSAYGPLVGSAEMTTMYLATLLRSAGWMGYLVYNGAFFADVHGFSLYEIGWTYTIGGLGFFLGTQLAGGRLGGRPLRLIYSAMLLLNGLCVGAILILPLGPLAAVGVLTIAAFALGVSGVSLATVLASRTPAGRGTTMTLNSSVMELGTAAGAAFGGLLVATGGYVLLGVGLPLVAFTSGALIFWQTRPKAVMSMAAAGD